MNRLPVKGDKVKYLGATDEQIKWGGNDDPRAVLTIGKEYEVEKAEVHSWHTKLTLVGLFGKFNSASFQILSAITSLTKEDFLSEEWNAEEVDERFHYLAPYFLKIEKGNYMGMYNPKEAFLQLMYLDPSKGEFLLNQPERFSVTIPCYTIENLRYLCNLLNIK